jgi:hypothetical protein
MIGDNYRQQLVYFHYLDKNPEWVPDDGASEFSKKC